MPREVLIDGIRYVPVSEAKQPVREVMARALAARYWGELGENWEADYLKNMEGVRVIITDGSTEGVDAVGFLDEVTARAARDEPNPGDS